MDLCLSWADAGGASNEAGIHREKCDPGWEHDRSYRVYQAKRLRNLLQERIVFLDGAMGTELQRSGLPAGVSVETWAASHIDTVKRIHRSSILAGSDVILSCTFGGTGAKLDSPEEVTRINTILAETALEEAGSAAIAAASIGPTGQLLHPSGELTWLGAYELFRIQIKAIAATGIDTFFLETFSDPRELKAAVLAVRDVVPDSFISAQMTFGEGAVSLAGTSPTALALLAEQLPVDAVGANCSTGPSDLLPVLQEMGRFTSRPLTAEPNAGLPVDGMYDMSPERFAGWMEDFARAGVSLIGGCCGTGPEHIRHCVSRIGIRPAEPARVEYFRALTSLDRIVPLGERTLAVGESINPTGRDALRKSIAEGDFFAITSLARAQGRADVIDVNLGLEKLLPDGLVHEVFSRLSLGNPVSVDLSSPVLLETAFRELGGIGILNSLTCAEEHIRARAGVLKRHGGYAVLLPIDENGIGEGPAERVRILRKGINILGGMGIPSWRILADPLVRPVGTGASGAELLETLDAFISEGLLTIAGVSNISHGLPGRSSMNIALLAAMASRGLDLAIIDVLDGSMLDVHRKTQILMGNLEPVERRLPELSPIGINPDFMQILEKCIIIGDRRGTESAGRELLDSGVPARDLLEKGLAGAMEKVGDLYSRRKLFLPHLISAAGAAETLTKLLEPHLKKEGDKTTRGRILIASVKGDIHDIGKNLVVLFLRNSGFEVTDMGHDVPAEEIIRKAIEIDADIIALSALMSSTAPEMEAVAEKAKTADLRARVLVGGAVITEEYAAAIGANAYAPDAFSAVAAADLLMMELKQGTEGDL